MLTRVGVTRGDGPDPGRGRTSVVTAPTDPAEWKSTRDGVLQAMLKGCRVLIPAGMVLVVVGGRRERRCLWDRRRPADGVRRKTRLIYRLPGAGERGHRIRLSEPGGRPWPGVPST